MMADPFDVDPSVYSGGIAPVGMTRGAKMTPAEAREERENRRNDRAADGVIVDSVKGVGRGFAGAVEGILEIPRIFGDDFMLAHDFQDNFGWGHSTSVPGSLIEGTTQFLAGFLPGTWGLGHVGKAGRAARLAKLKTVAAKKRTAQALAAGEDVAATVAKVRARDILAQAARMGGSEKKLIASQYGKSVAVGALADFAVFTQDEMRLSNLLQHFGADNAVVNFLAANPDDEGAIGRFKNMLEGAGIGFALEGVVRIVRNLFKRQQILRDASLTGKRKLERLESLERENAQAADEALSTPTEREIQQEARAPERTDAGANADLKQRDNETQAAWRQRLQAETRKHPSTKGQRGGSAEELQQALIEARQKTTEQAERKQEFLEARQRMAGESPEEFAARLERGEVDTPAAQVQKSDTLEIEYRDYADEIDATYGAGASKLRVVEESYKDASGKIKKRKVWYGPDGEELLDELDLTTGRQKRHPLKQSLMNLARKERAYQKERMGEILLGTRPPHEGFVPQAHHADLKLIGGAVLRSGIDGSTVKKIIVDMDQAIRNGEDPLEKIEGVINLAVLDESTSRNFMALMAKHGAVDPAKFRNHTGELLKLTYDKKSGTWLDPQGRNWDQAAQDEASVQHWADLHGITYDESLARLRAYGKALDPEVPVTLTPAKAAAIEDVSARQIHEASVRAQSMVHFIDRQLRDATELFGATQGGAAGDALRTKLDLKSADHARVLLGRWIDENAEMLSAYGRARAETGRALRRYKLTAGHLLTDERITGMMQEMGGAEWLDKVGLKLFAAEASGNHVKIAALKQIDRNRRVWFGINEYFVNAILSGLRTLSTNTLGNAVTSIYGPLESLLGARTKLGLKSLSGKALEEMEMEVFRATKEFTELWSQIADSAAIAKQTWNPKGTGFWRGIAEDSEYHLDPGRGTLDIPESQQKAWSAANWAEIRGQELDPARFGQRVVEKLGKVLRIPSKALMTTDEFFKQWNYRTVAKADLMVRAHQLNKSGQLPEGTTIDQWVDQELTNLTARGQALIRSNLIREAESRFPADSGEWDYLGGRQERKTEMSKWIEDQLKGPLVDRGAIADRAIALSRERTFTTELEAGSGVLSDLGVTLTQFGGRHPWFRLVTPFIRTPLNILMYAGRRAPMLRPQDTVGAAEFLYKHKLHGQTIDAMKTKFAKELMSENPRVRVDAVARFQASIGWFAGMSFAASTGHITGAGPGDKDLRRAMTDAGWMPYSVKIGDQYYSYQKLDPLATVIGLYADVFDAHKYSSVDEDDELQRIGLALITSTLHNLESKSYLQVLVNAAGLLSDPEVNVSGVTGRYLSAFAIPSVFAGFREIADESLVEVRSPLDQLLSRIPGISSIMLDPQRNVLGERIDRRKFKGAAKVVGDINAVFNPILVNTTGSDLITQELALLEYGFSNPSRMRFGVDMADYRDNKGQSGYDRWMELVGEIRLGRDRRNVRQRLERLIKSSAYQKLPIEGLAAVGVDSPRIVQIRKLLTKYRGYALKQMLREFPALAEAARDHTVARSALRQGVDPTLIRAQLFPVE